MTTPNPMGILMQLEGGAREYLQVLANPRRSPPPTKREMTDFYGDAIRDSLVSQGLVESVSSPEGAVDRPTALGREVAAAIEGEERGGEEMMADVLAFVEQALTTAGLGDDPHVQQMLIDLERGLHYGAAEDARFSEKT